MKPAEELKGRLKVKVQGKNTLEKDANGKGKGKKVCSSTLALRKLGISWAEFTCVKLSTFGQRKW